MGSRNRLERHVLVGIGLKVRVCALGRPVLTRRRVAAGLQPQALHHQAQVVVDDATITSHIKRIRRKFLAVDPAFAAIETVYGVGYRWVSAA